MLLSYRQNLDNFPQEEIIAVFFATKATYLSYLFWGAEISFLILASFATCLFFRRMETICLITATILLVKIIGTFPYTINHFMFEFLIAILLFLWFIEKLDASCLRGEIDRDSWVIHYGKIIFASVWIYAGIQKIVQGEYLNGQFFLFTFAENSDQMKHLMAFMQSFLRSDLLALNSAYLSSDFVSRGINLESFQSLRMLSIAIGWSVTLSEIILPIWVIAARRKLLPCLVWYAIQVSIGYFSKEIDFMWSCLIMQGLFVPNPYRKSVLVATLISMTVFHCLGRFVL